MQVVIIASREAIAASHQATNQPLSSAITQKTARQSGTDKKETVRNRERDLLVFCCFFLPHTEEKIDRKVSARCLPLSSQKKSA